MVTTHHHELTMSCCWLLLLLLLFLKGRWACIVITGPSLKRIGQPNKRDTQLKSLYTHPSQWISWWFSFYCQVLNSISSFYFPHSSSSLISVVKRYIDFFEFWRCLNNTLDVIRLGQINRSTFTILSTFVNLFHYIIIMYLGFSAARYTLLDKPHRF
jgi:hypothetical protein